MTRMDLTQLLARNKFVVDDEQHHIIFHKELCDTCLNKSCLYACPAGLYTLKNGEISFDDAGCLECGTCRIVCPCPGAIEWHYPRGTFGIIYRYG